MTQTNGTTQYTSYAAAIEPLVSYRKREVVVYSVGQKNVG